MREVWLLYWPGPGHPFPVAESDAQRVGSYDLGTIEFAAKAAGPRLVTFDTPVGYLYDCKPDSTTRPTRVLFLTPRGEVVEHFNPALPDERDVGFQLGGVVEGGTIA